MVIICKPLSNFYVEQTINHIYMKQEELNPLVFQNEVTTEDKNQVVDVAPPECEEATGNETTSEEDEVLKNYIPEWDLSGFFKGIDDPEIENTKKTISDTIQDLIKDKGKLFKMKDYELLTFIRKYEQIIILSRSLLYFASLNLCTQRTNQEALLFEKKIEEYANKVHDGIGWIRHAMYSLPPEKKIEFLQSQKLRDYQEWMMCCLLLPPALSEAVSRAVRKMSSLSTGWYSLYKQMISKLNFTMGKKTYTFDEISELAHRAKDKATRNKALKVMSDEFSRHGYIFTQTLNSIYKEEDVMCKIHLYNEDEDEICFDALDRDGFANGLNRENVLSIATAVTDSYVPISQRFYKLLAKMSGKQSIDYNDRLINPIKIEERSIPWVEAVKVVVGTLLRFNEEMGMTAVEIVNSNTIHAKPQEGKDAGAFCINGSKPYIFLNYRGGYDSMIAFAHELGHAIHHIYSEVNAGILNDGTTISMSEVASIFNEKLICNALMSGNELSNQEKLYMLIEDVNRQIADIHRQIAFSKFELRAFRERQSGELSEERFSQIYSEEMERYLGFPLSAEARCGWMAIPHVFNSPFYVRYYAFAGMVVNKLWQVYKSGEIEDFALRYVDMLSNTGLEDIDSLLEPFELDMNEADFWSSALIPISKEIDEIERLAKLEGLI